MSTTPRHVEISADSLSASGLTSDKQSLPALQSKMKCDPEGYEAELALLYGQFKSTLELFQQQAALNFTSLSGIGNDPTVSKDLGDRAMFLAHVTPFYPKQLSQFPEQLAEFLSSAARTLPSFLRCHITQALILLINRKMVDMEKTLPLFMDLQILGDKALRKLAFSHVVHSIKRMNQKRKTEVTNRALKRILFRILEKDDEAKAKQSLITLCELHRRKVWFDDETANAICKACHHQSPRIMIAALSFVLDYENAEDDDDDGSSSEDDLATPQPQVLLCKQAIYKANHQGTTSSKKKKKAKLQRAIRSMKRQQRVSSENSSSNYYSPLYYLKDEQGFAEKLFSRLQSCNERFEVKMMMLKVVARTIGLHRLIILKFYDYMQKYVQPHQRDVTSLLAAAVQACHEMVPPDAVAPLFRQIVNQFVHDRSRTEAIAVGLNVVREMCVRMPLLMTEDLLQDLVLYRKSHEKAVSAAARSLMTLFREVCPSLLIKKDRGRPTNPKARPKAFGEATVASDVPDVELLHEKDDSDDDIDTGGSGDGEDSNGYGLGSSSEDNIEVAAVEEDAEDNDDEDGGGGGRSSNSDNDDISMEADSEDIELQEEDEVAEEEEDGSSSDNDADVSDKDDGEWEEEDEQEQSTSLNKARDSVVGGKDSKGQKRKFSDFDRQLNAADTSLRALVKRLAGAKNQHLSSDITGGILSNEDYKRIKELKAKKEARIALSRHGCSKKGLDAKATAFKVPSSDQLTVKRVDPAILDAHVKKKLSKEERLALIRAGREDRVKYQARTAVKQNKTGGMSNRQKEHKKAMPLAAKRAKVARSRVDKRKKQQRAGKQFRGRKAWK